MKTKAYPKYKPSGVEWLGDVPEHWGKISLKWASTRYSGGTPDKAVQEYWEDGTIPWLNSGAVNDDYIIEPSEYITEDAFRNSSAKWIPKNALVMALAGQGKTKGMVGQLGFSTTCNQSMAAIVPDNTLSPRLLYWWLTKNYINIRNLAGGEARDGLNLDLIGSIPVPLLPLPEQQAIAAFLDRETGRIDALIAKKKNLLSLLAEQRTALISRAVTKGLNPSVKLKPSSVEWLGDVPEHWEVKKGKYLGVLQSTPNVDEEEQTEEGGLINYIKVDDLNSLDNIPFFKKSRLDCTIIKKPFVQNALIFPKRGAAIFTNKVSILLGKALLDPNMMGWKILKKYNLKYVYHTLLLRGLDDLADTSTVPQINNKHIYPEVFPLPPLPEQQAIAAFLDRETAKIDTLSAKVLTAIERLKEYRTALISAAVTGKIDVREAV